MPSDPTASTAHPTYRHIYLEPHFDDVALSCGATLAGQASRGEPALVVTLFAGNPGRAPSETDFVREHHDKWRSGADPIAERAAEQRRALELLGADWLPLPFLDAIYRDGQYLSDQELFGPVKPGDRALVGRIAAALAAVAARQPAARWYVPLALGNHVDHQLAIAGSAALPERLAYEDYPYAQRHGGMEARAAELGARSFETTPIDDRLELKIAAIACYRSQLPVLFGSSEAMPELVRAFARARGGERLWRLPEEAGGAMVDFR
ncbi:MAG TPA: PIG-L family deacetylase [Chloroflexota bacterium]